jgi:NADPH:quinone reductase-like Zn-dependent oxidoreductase
VQLAAHAGAEVVASVGSVARGSGLLGLGASEVVVGVEQVTTPVFGALDNVGGQQLALAFALLEPGGAVQSIGMASLEPTTIDPETMRRSGGGGRLECFSVGGEMGADIAYLCRLLARGEIDTPIGWRSEWDRVEEAADALLSRKVAGKAVLDVPH